MTLLVVAEPPERFAAWLAGQRKPAAAPTDTLAARGHQIFEGGSCATCHAISSTLAGGRVGPDLTHVAGRIALAAGAVPNTPGNLAGWIVDPQTIKPGCIDALACGSARGPACAGRLSGDTPMTFPISSSLALPPAVDEADRERLHRTWAPRAGVIGWLMSVNHKSVGKRYIITALVFFLLAGSKRGVMRLQLSRPENGLIGPDLYNQLFTMHGSTMMFLFAVPIVTGDRDLSRPPHDRRAQRRLPAAECLRILGVISSAVLSSTSSSS